MKSKELYNLFFSKDLPEDTSKEYELRKILDEGLKNNNLDGLKSSDDAIKFLNYIL